MSKLLFLIKEEIKIFFKAKGGVFWVFIFPVVTLLIFGLVFGNVSSMKTKVGVIDKANSARSAFYIENLKVFKNLTVISAKPIKYKNRLKNNKLDIVLILKRGFGAAKNPVTIVYNFNRSRDIFFGLTTVRAYTKAFLDFKKAGRASRKIEEVDLRAKKRSYIEFLISGIISMVILSMAIFSVGTKLAYMKENGFLKRLSITPISRVYYIIANIIAALIIITVVSLLLLLEAHFVFAVEFPVRLLQWAGFLILGTASSLSLAFLLPSLTSNGDKANSIGQLLFFLMMFLGGAYFPVESMPVFLKDIAYLLPISYFNDGLRRLYFNDLFQMHELIIDSVVLASTFLLFSLISVWRFKWIDDE